MNRSSPISRLVRSLLPSRALRTLFVAPLLLAPLSVGVAMSAGCAPPASKTANPTKPISERRALDVIARAVKKAKLKAVDGRDIVTDGGDVHIDVAVDDHQFGVVYLTDNDRANSDTSRLPRREGKSNKLLVARGIGKATGAVVLILYDTDYLYDDQVGEEHEQTAITAERTLERDVTDFLVTAKSEKWE
jgi:hypothetical protein